jgi:hypothetical protein
MKKLIVLIATLLTSLAAGQAMAVAVTIEAHSDILTAEGETNATGTGSLSDGVLHYQLEYVIDIPIFGEPTILVVTGVLMEGSPPTGEAVALSCTGSDLVCGPIPLNEFGAEYFEYGDLFSETEETTLIEPPSSSGNSSPTYWTITPVTEKPIQVTVDAYAEYPDGLGEAVGTGTGELVIGVLTYEMEYVLDLTIFEKSTMIIKGTVFDGIPPKGLTSITACEGSSLVCGGLELGSVRTESFESGGPISETEETVLHAGESASGRTPPSTTTITPIIERRSGGGGGGGCAIGSGGRFDPTLPAILLSGLGLLGWRRLKARR